MTITEIREILESPYDRKAWKGFLQTQFTNNKLNAEDRPILLSDKVLSNKCYSLGTYEISEYSRIGIFEVELNEKVNITRNRVALRNLIKDLTKQVAGAMVVFVQGEKWRFSYVSKRKVKDQSTNEIQDRETAPKRYTYLFGKNEKALTAAIRFDKLIQKQRENIFQYLSLDDFEEAFSVEKLSREFFKNYKEAYEDFVQFITGKRYTKKGNKYVEQEIHKPDWQLTAIFGKDEKQARDFCKRMMGRIVFLYFIQKKGWLAVRQFNKWGEGNPNYLYDLFRDSGNKDDFYYQELVPLFFKTLNNPDSEKEENSLRFPYLNGGLFDDSQDKKYNKLHLPENIFKNLFETFNNYNFTVYEDAPDEHTVAVDPEMLGHIFENLLEDNKDKGAFYTPKEIVHYMCAESLKEYLFTYDKGVAINNQSARSTIDKIIRQQELSVDEKQYAEKNAYEIITALEKVKICDPAIGSGAFPMGLLQEIFNAQIYLHELKGFKKDVTDAEIKKRIIEESIYGVDIDPGAVDIARLRFWLSLVVDEHKPQPLPNLDFKIVCANTLVSLGEMSDLDFDDRAGQAVKELEILRHNFFNVASENKLKLERQFKKIQTDLLSHSEFSSKANFGIYGKLYEFNPFEDTSCSWFDPWWMFGVKGGFDIVIGNPPYAGLRTSILSKSFVEYAKKNFKLAVGQFDYFTLFIEVAHRLAKDNGIVSLIIPKALVSNQNFELARKFLMYELGILTYVDTHMPFESASVESNVIICRKKSESNVVNNLTYQNSEFLPKGLFDIKMSNKLPFNIFPLLLNEGEYELIIDIQNNADSILGKTTEIIRGFEFGFNHPSISQKTGNYKVVKGENVHKYSITHSGYYVDADFSNSKVFKRKEYFLDTPKLLTRFVSNELIFAYDDVGYCNTNVVYNVHSSNKAISLKYLLGLLNSKLLNFWFFKVYLNDDKLFPHIQKNQLESIPLILSKSHFVNSIITLVEYLLHLYDAKTPQIISHTDNTRVATHIQDVLDMLVYELYFEDHMKANGLDVLQFIAPEAGVERDSNSLLLEQIKNFYLWYQKPENAVRQRILLISTRSKDKLALLN